MEIISRVRDLYATHKRDIAVGTLIFLIGTLGFGLGYLYAKEENHAPIIIEQVNRDSGE